MDHLFLFYEQLPRSNAREEGTYELRRLTLPTPTFNSVKNVNKIMDVASIILSLNLNLNDDS